MTELLLRRELEPAAQQQRRLQTLRRLTLLWFVLAAVAVVLTVTQTQFPLPALWALFGVAIVAAIGALACQMFGSTTDYSRLARDIATENPELHALLVTAMEQQRDPATGRLSFLQQRVLNEALEEIRRREEIRAVPRKTAVRAQLLHGASLLLLVAALVGMPRQRTATAKPLIAAAASVSVSPGNANIEKGSALVVLATFKGSTPSAATLVISSNGVEHRVPLAQSLNDPMFGGSIPEVHAPLRYRIEHDSGGTPEYSVSVFEHPRLDRADVQVTYPEYTGLASKTVRDTRRVTAVEGSVLNLTLRFNKPVKTARLVPRTGPAITLTTVSNSPEATLSGFRLERSHKYDLHLVDADGRTNKVPAQFALDALTNQRPVLRLAAPRGDQRVSPLQELLFQAEAQDDFGLRGWGLTYNVGGEQEQSLTLGGTTPANVRTNYSYLLALESLRVEPDQLVSYFVWAEDFGPDGKLRRTSSDMFFAEVRPFEEIFREAEAGGAQQQQQQQQQQQGGNQSPATKLAELQKQIINATWRLQRQESPINPGSRYQRDVPVVRDSQQQAIDQVEAMQENLQELRMKEFAEAAQKQMETAVRHLTEATNSPRLLPKALAAEQAAYQALLKLQAREHQVMQAQNQSGSQQQRSSQRNQAQVNQLQLKRQQNPYETQREAAPQTPPEKREQLEALSRLKELAQRQEDINERLKELQTELLAAKTESEREQLRRELKRLREEQREMLADIDELRQKMDRGQKTPEMAESRQQLEQARQDAQRASEALEQGSVSQALSAGTRTERQLAETRDELRRASSGQFSEEMKEMRNNARGLAEKEEAIQRDLESLAEKPKALSDAGRSEELARQLNEQRQGVTNLLEQMRRVTEQAEAAEPLLYKELYDSLRKNSQSSVEESLTAAEELTRRNFLREARPFEQRAAQDIEALKQDVDRAAASVLGDETESLRNAKREIERLAQELDRELQRKLGTNGPGGRMTAGGAGTNNAAGRQTNGLAGAGRGLGTNQMAAQNGTNRINLAAPAGRSRDTNAPFAPGNETNSTARLAMNDPRSQERARGERSGQSSRSGGERAQSESGQNSGSPGEQRGNQEPRDQQSGPGENGRNDSQQASNRGGERQGRGGRGQDRFSELFNERGSDDREGAETGGGGTGPLTGAEEYSRWSQRLSNVEELVDRPALRNQIAQARDRARAMRAEFKRHSKEPKWDLVRLEILKPLVEVRDQLADELSRRESKESLAPIDRDPVPGQYGELVRRYYETLGGSQ